MPLKRNDILKWLGEGVLIIISVLLAFLIEGKRQEDNQRQDLITLLTDLKSSFRTDSITLHIRIFYLHKMDSSNKAALKTIERNEFPTNIDELDVFNPIGNYSLKRVLNNNHIGLLSKKYREEIYSYNTWQDYLKENYEKRYDENCSKLLDLVYEEGKQVTASIKFKGLIQKNIDLISEMISNDSSAQANAHELIHLTQDEIQRLTEN